MVEKKTLKKTEEKKEKFAVIRTGGKQYLVRESEVLEVERLEVGDDQGIVFDEVLLFVNGDKIEIGNPLVDKARVIANFIQEKKGQKQIIFKYKAKKNYRVKTGHRQKYSQVRIEKLLEGNK
jgi:large subunit ribosomal protein L21